MFISMGHKIYHKHILTWFSIIGIYNSIDVMTRGSTDSSLDNKSNVKCLNINVARDNYHVEQQL